MSEQVKLLPCPFCGSEDLRAPNAALGIECRGCGVWMPAVASSDHDRSHDATTAWNRRVPMEKAREALLFAVGSLEAIGASGESGERASAFARDKARSLRAAMEALE